MANNSRLNSSILATVANFTKQEDALDLFKTPWLVGICASYSGFVLQLIYLTLIPNCRKYDERVLTQLTIARSSNTVLEYLIMMNVIGKIKWRIVKDILYVLYFHTDLVLVLWMYVFTKKLYDKVVIVFSTQDWSVLTISVIIWFLPLPIAVLLQYVLTNHIYMFRICYRVYAFTKFLVLFMNLFLFINIFGVVFRRGVNNTRNKLDFMKAAVISFMLVSMTSLQVMATDLFSLFYGESDTLIKSFCVVNSYQVLLVTAIFVILANGKLKDPVMRVMSMRLKEIVIN